MMTRHLLTRRFLTRRAAKGLACLAAASGLAWVGSAALAIVGGRGGSWSPVMGLDGQPEPGVEPATSSEAPAGRPEASVVMLDGSRYTGFINAQTDEEVLVEVGGVELRLSMREVDRIDVLPPIKERYERLRASLADDDIPGLLGLVNWLVSRQQYELAEEQLLEVLRLEPRHPRALELHRLIQAERTLRSVPPVEAGDGGERDEPGAAPRDFPVLSPEEINLIRVYELDLQRMPRVTIKRETVERLIEEYAGDPLIPATIEGREALFRAARQTPRRIVEIIFRLKARHLYDQIEVLENPRSMQMFRERVHQTWLINACATCHNTREDAPAGPRFVTRRPNSDTTVYSNFLILERYHLSDGTPLIRYDDPAASPVLHMGMPRAIADYPHPDVAAARGWRPVFLSVNTSAYKSTVEWIRSMYLPRPEYPIEYPPVEEGAGEGEAGEPIER